jgi:hypothetical protein
MMNAQNSKDLKTCAGSRQWPRADQTGYHCRDCGRKFARSDLQGRDDHMPMHYTQNSFSSAVFAAGAL